MGERQSISVTGAFVARVLINEARARRLGHGHGFWCFFNMAQSARRRHAEAPPEPSLVTAIDTAPALPPVPTGTQWELFA